MIVYLLGWVDWCWGADVAAGRLVKWKKDSLPQTVCKGRLKTLSAFWVFMKMRCPLCFFSGSTCSLYFWKAVLAFRDGNIWAMCAGVMSGIEVMV